MVMFLLFLVGIYLFCGAVLGVFYLAGTLSDPEERKKWDRHLMALPLVVFILPAVSAVDLLRHLVRELRPRSK